MCSIPSPILAGLYVALPYLPAIALITRCLHDMLTSVTTRMCRSPYFWGRRGTMVIGALVTMAFFFAYTQVKSNAENLGFTCAIGFCLVSAPFLPVCPVTLPTHTLHFHVLSEVLSVPSLPTRWCLVYSSNPRIASRTRCVSLESYKMGCHLRSTRDASHVGVVA